MEALSSVAYPFSRSDRFDNAEPVGAIPNPSPSERRPLFDCARSVVERYCDRLKGLNRRFLVQASISERAAILDAGEISGVRIALLDMTTGSATGTFKDWLACVTIAHCLQEGIECFVTQTSGNTGNALARYADRQGIRVIVFYPAASRYKIDGRLARSPHVTFIEVDRPEPEIKRLTARFSRKLGLPWLPAFSHQVEANKLRAYVLEEYALAGGERWNWHVQALSSGYGIFGLYRGLDELAGTAGAPACGYPRLLGIQQEAVHPFADYLEGRPSGTQPTIDIGPRLIEPTLFRSTLPNDLLRRMEQICCRHCGHIAVLENRRFHERLVQAVDLLRSNGLCVGPPRCKDVRPREQAALVATVGLLEQIERGRVRPGESALIALTGGVDPPGRLPFTPRLRIPGGGNKPDLAALVAALAIEVGTACA